MKKYLVAGFVVIAVLVSTGTGWAQGIGGGVKFGVNFASVSGEVDPGADKSTRTGMVAGGFLRVPITAVVAFQPEVLYSMQGVKFEERDGTKITAKIDEVQIPLLLRLGGNPLHALVGPSIGFITGAKLKFGRDEEDFKDDLKSTDIGFVFGAGTMLGHFLLEGRYTVGMTNLNDDDSDGDNKSQVFAVLIGFGF